MMTVAGFEPSMFKAAATTVSALLSLITFERVRHIDTL
jgi:hypothetical protein